MDSLDLTVEEQPPVDEYNLSWTPPKTPEVELKSVDSRKETPTPIVEPTPVPADKPKLTANEEKEMARTYHQYVTLKHEVSSSNKLDSKNTVTIPMPSVLAATLAERFATSPNADFSKDSRFAGWYDALRKSATLYSGEKNYLSALGREGADYRDDFEFNAVNMMGREPKVSNPNNVIRGEQASFLLNSHLGLGTTYSMPLYSSGFRVVFKPAQEIDMLELDRQVAEDRARLGFETYGLIFSNILAYSIGRYLDFALNHVWSSNLYNDGITPEHTYDHMSIHDIPDFLFGFMCANYPNGYNYRRPCSSEPGICNHVLEDTLNLRKLHLVDFSRFTDWQLTHMSDKSKTRSIEDIRRYKEELPHTKKKRIELNAGGAAKPITVVLKVPTVREYLTSGDRWLSKLIASVDRLVASPSDESDAAARKSERDRERRLDLFIKSQLLRQYGHWVDSIEINGSVAEDIETIESLLNDMSALDTLRDQLLEEINNYITDTSTTVIGIKNYSCEVCQAKQGEGAESVIIPLDVTLLFFDLHTQLGIKVWTRSTQE